MAIKLTFGFIFDTNDPQFKAVDRVERLRHVSAKWREPSQSDRMYNEPSYLRRDTSINSEAQGIGDASSFTIGPGDGEGNRMRFVKTTLTSTII